jgi:hypothetical protein
MQSKQFVVLQSEEGGDPTDDRGEVGEDDE